MPNIKSAEKRVKVSETKKLQNQIVRSRMHTALKKFNAAIAEGNTELATQLLPETCAMVDKAAVEHVIHKNAANHKKSQLSRSLYQLQQGIVVVKMDAKTLKQAEQKAAAQRKAEENAKLIAERKAAKEEKEAAKTNKKKKK